VRAADATPREGDFWILKIAHAPSPKNLSKNVSGPYKGGSLCVKDVFAKKIFGVGRAFRWWRLRPQLSRAWRLKAPAAGPG